MDSSPSSSSSQPALPKVAIPRLAKVAIPKLQPRPNAPHRAGFGAHTRIGRACLNCRTRKVKCHGNKPTCVGCQDSGVECIYVFNRRDRLRITARHNEKMIELLKELSQQVSPQNQTKIDEMLRVAIDDVAENSAFLLKNPKKDDKTLGDREEESDESDEKGEEVQEDYNITASVGSSANPDHKHVPRGPMRTASPASNLTIIDLQHGLHSHRSDHPFNTSMPPEQNNCRTTTVQSRHTNSRSLFLDDQSFEMDFEVDPLVLPAKEDAEPLLNLYMDHCHPSFPLLAREAFRQEFYRYYRALEREMPYTPSREWQTQLNLVLAIAAMRSYPTAIVGHGNECDHVTYYYRALALSIKDPWWFSRQELPQMQIIGLLSFHSLLTGHINRSWVLSGIALRLGYALGLHTYSTTCTSSLANKELISRIWWGHSALETLLATLTGRPSIGVVPPGYVPFPLPISTSNIRDEAIQLCHSGRLNSEQTRTTPSSNAPDQSISGSAQNPLLAQRGPSYAIMVQLLSRQGPSQAPSNSGTFLTSMFQLSEIAQHSLSLYTASTVGPPWHHVQPRMELLLDRLISWTESLPNGFKLLTPSKHPRPQDQREGNIVAMTYHSTVMLILRPCLCRLNRRENGQGIEINGFTRTWAQVGVRSAKAVLKLLPEGPGYDLALLYDRGPWWNLPYIITQSAVVLLLEISFEAAHVPYAHHSSLADMKTFIGWLRAMRHNCGIAKRGYHIIINMLTILVATVPMDIADVFREDQEANAAAAAAETLVNLPHSVASRVPDQTMRFDQTQGPRLPSFAEYVSDGSQPMESDQTQGPKLPPLVGYYASGGCQPMHSDPPQGPGLPQLAGYDSGRSQPMLSNQPQGPGLPQLAGNVQRANDPARKYLNVFADVHEMARSDFPNFFYTIHDQRNPLPGFREEDQPIPRVEYYPQNMPTASQNVPTASQNVPTASQNVPTASQNVPTIASLLS